MAAKTKIEWTDASWSPIRALDPANGKIGWHCEHATTGCEFCYAEGMNKRLGTGLPFKPGHRKDIRIFLDEQMLTAPLRWKRPRMVFCCSMTDLFADFVKDEWIDKIFAVMALCPQHTFQVLTKRAERMRDYFRVRQENFGRCSDALFNQISHTFSEAHHEASTDVLDMADLPDGRPQPNVWLGVSAERQQEADERIPLLLQTPAAVRFVSCEPLLGPIDLTAIEAPDKVEGERWTFNALESGDYYTQWSETMLGEPRRSGGDGPYRERRIDWVIAGGESGRGARPAHVGWFRSLRDQCAASDAPVPYFFKQHGEWRPPELGDPAFNTLKGRAGSPPAFLIASDGTVHCTHEAAGSGAEVVLRVGKKAAGRLLDGREHSAFPEAAR